MSYDLGPLVEEAQSHGILRKRLLFAALLSAYLMMWIGGVVSYTLLERPHVGTEWAGPLFLLLASLIVIVTTDRTELIVVLLSSTIGFVAEIIGVHYQFLFGKYSYTQTLNPQLLGVPLVMASAWMILISYVRQMLLRFNLPGSIETFVVALWMVVIDLLIDPLAAGRLNYWQWKDSGLYYGIPFHNFLGWFIVSFLIFNLIRLLLPTRRVSNLWAKHTGLSILLFFTLIALSEQLFYASLAGILLLLIHIIIIAPLNSGVRKNVR